MTTTEFLARVIDGGIAGATADYSANTPNDKMMLEGAVAGFESCRGKSPEQLAILLREARINQTRAHAEQLPDYWRHACFAAEIEWVCNCVSALLQNEGLPIIVTPTARGFLRAAEIVGVQSNERAPDL